MKKKKLKKEIKTLRYRMTHAEMEIKALRMKAEPDKFVAFKRYLPLPEIGEIRITKIDNDE